MNPTVQEVKHAAQEAANPGLPIVRWAAAALLIAIIAATYWSALSELVQRWCDDPDYLHGFLVPVFAAALLWQRRAMLQGAGSREQGAKGGRHDASLRRTGSLSVLRREPGMEFQGSLWGLLLMGIAAAMRMASSYYYYDLLDPLSLVPCLAGITLFATGWKALAWAWPGIVFLVFMVPLPGLLANAMGAPLQQLATAGSTYVIQTIGISAVAEGNVISLAGSQIGVAEACSGLRNMMLFLAVCTGLVFLGRRTAVENTIIIISSAVIALSANVVRIAATAILHETVSHAAATTLYHDLAGWFMMPLAVIFLWLELAYLNRVFVRPATSDT